MLYNEGMYKDRIPSGSDFLLGAFFVTCIILGIGVLSDRPSVQKTASVWSKAMVASTQTVQSKKCVDESTAKLGLRTWCYPGCLYKVDIQRSGELLDAQYVGDQYRYGAVIYSTYSGGSSAPLSCNHGGTTQPSLAEVLSKAGVRDVHTIAPSGFGAIIERPPLEQYLGGSANYAPGAVQATPLDGYQQYGAPIAVSRTLPINNNPPFNFGGDHAWQLDSSYSSSHPLSVPSTQWTGGYAVQPDVSSLPQYSQEVGYIANDDGASGYADAYRADPSAEAPQQSGGWPAGSAGGVQSPQSFSARSSSVAPTVAEPAGYSSPPTRVTGPQGLQGTSVDIEAMRNQMGNQLLSEYGKVGGESGPAVRTQAGHNNGRWASGARGGGGGGGGNLGCKNPTSKRDVFACPSVVPLM